MKKIALFDFDGTITNNDSLIALIRFIFGNTKLIIGLLILSPILIAYKIKLMSNQKAKEYMLSYFFKNMNKDTFMAKCRKYSLTKIDKHVRPKAMNKLNWHKKQGHKIVIISASLECWLAPWCEKNNFELIATKIEIKNGKISGNLLGKNCYGIEKVNRLKKRYNINDFDYIYTYGDSTGDKELLALANESYYKPFKK